jgi:hypothetical protein
MAREKITAYLDPIIINDKVLFGGWRHLGNRGVDIAAKKAIAAYPQFKAEISIIAEDMKRQKRRRRV